MSFPPLFYCLFLLLKNFAAEKNQPIYVVKEMEMWLPFWHVEFYYILSVILVQFA